MVDSSPSRARILLAAALTLLALLNLTAGVWRSLSPAGAADLITVARWSRDWLAGGNPYVAPALTDYPPWALVALAPLAAVPVERLPAVWAMVNLALVFVIARRLASVTREPRSTQALLVLLVASTAAVRTLSQFSLLSYALAVAGALSGPTWRGGLLSGLSLMKPQIGGVAILWMIVRGRWRRAAIALAVPAVLLLIFCAHARVDPVTLAARYREILASIHGTPTALPGHSDLRLWLWSLWPTPAGNFALSIAALAVLLTPLAMMAVRRAELTSDQDLELLALAGAVSLLAVRHLSYDFILFLPALMAWRCPPFGIRAHAPRLLFAALAALLVVAVPSWVRLAIDRGAPEALGVLTEIDRVMCLTLWAVLSWRLTKRSTAL